ncbi:MAG: peptidase M16 [Desulfovibrio sp.]|nr:MAG: peptidase M16 [Desulfovibrio sp.]
MSVVHGFELIRERDIAEVRSMTRLWRHARTGAELLSLCGDDENKVFGVTFRTPPANSTGVAHILEHSVLCGSEKYPVKEPFVELLKGSLQTFLNAFTYPDKTCYPVASTNLKDFYNLVDVYLDAVFHPRISEYILRQEGWRMEPGNGDTPMHFKGVVFNEMKGAYSSPDSLLYEYSQQALFPDHPYGLDSGGDPERIPDLTYEEFLSFHENYYHPSNARFYFYGDDPEDERLKIVNQVIKGYDLLNVDSDVALQGSLKGPLKVRKTYAGDKDPSARTKRSMVTVNWLLPDTAGRTGGEELFLELTMLEHILIGLPASPLRKALIDSGMGEDLAGAGLENELKQLFFSTGLKSVASKEAGKIEKVILDTLTHLAEHGVPEEAIEAAVNSLEFELREKNTGRFPRGLHVMLRALTSWLYNGDPLARIGFEPALEDIKNRLMAGEPIFENLLKEYFLDNTDRVRVLLEPDPELGPEREARERARLDQAAQALGETGMAELRAESEELQRIQEAPDPPEALATIPRLALGDMAQDNILIPLEERDSLDIPVLNHDLPTDGIVYMDMALDLMDIEPSLLPLVPLLGRAFLETGTKRRSFVDLSTRIARKTGGVETDVFAATRRGVYSGGRPLDKKAVAKLLMRGKATKDKARSLLDIMRETLLEAKLADPERFRQIVQEEKARLEHRLAPMGHMIAASRLMSRMSAAGRMDDHMGGVAHLEYLRKLSDTVDTDWPKVEAALKALRSRLVLRSNTLINITSDYKTLRALDKDLDALAAALPKEPKQDVELIPGPVDWPGAGDFPDLSGQPPQREGLAIPAQVNYVGLGMDLAAQGFTYHGSMEAVIRYVRTGFLWDAVRVRGGAYGAMAFFDRMSGSMALVSYRDPHIRRTLQVFTKTAEHLATLSLDKDELEKSIIGAIGGLDAHLLPDAKGFVSMSRKLTGDSDEARQLLREELLGTTQDDFRRVGEALKAALDSSQVTVLGSRDALEAAAKDLDLEVATLF